MIYTGSNRNNSSCYDKDEEIKIHFYDEDQSFKNRQILKEKIKNINKKMNDIENKYINNSNNNNK